MMKSSPIITDGSNFTLASMVKTRKYDDVSREFNNANPNFQYFYSHFCTALSAAAIMQYSA